MSRLSHAQVLALLASGGLPPIVQQPVYGHDLDHLLAVSGAEPAYGLEIYGNDEHYMGAEAYGAGLEIYGAEAYGAAPFQRNAPRWLGQRAAPNQPVGVNVQQRPGTHARRFPLGFASAAAIAAGSAATVTAQPQVPYRPERMVVPSDIAGSFDITDIKVGKDSQFVAAGAIPARAFTETAPDNLLSFHGVAISQIISIAVVNTGGASLTFKALMVGTAVE